ncbi:hypothetical protein D3C83_190520 [compost metagenome]
MSHLMRITTSSAFTGNLLVIPLNGSLTLNALPCVDRLCTLCAVLSLFIAWMAWPTRTPTIRGTKMQPR